MRKGLFISLEGPDGSGKTTNLPFVETIFRLHGFHVKTYRDPGGCAVSEEIRSFILSKRDPEHSFHSLTELLLFEAARVQLHKTEIEPFLSKSEKNVVIIDRFCDSTFAYQGFGNGNVKEVLGLEALLFQEAIPNYTLFFNVSLETSLERIQKRKKEYNRLNEKELLFREKTFKGYQERLRTYPERMIAIDADCEARYVKEQLRTRCEGIIEHFHESKKLPIIQGKED